MKEKIEDILKKICGEGPHTAALTEILMPMLAEAPEQYWPPLIYGFCVCFTEEDPQKLMQTGIRATLVYGFILGLAAAGARDVALDEIKEELQEQVWSKLK